MLAGTGSMQALVPPQMMLIEAVGAIDSLWLNRAIMPRSAASGQGPRSCASATDAASASRRILRKIFRFHDFARALAQRGIARPLHAVGRDRDEMREHVVEEPQHVLDEARHVVPFVPCLDVERRQTAHRRTLLVAVVL